MKIKSAAIIPHLKNHKFPYILIFAALLFSIPVLIDLVKDWLYDDNYSHGFLIIPISIYLFYRKRNELIFPAKHSNLGTILFAIGCIGTIFGAAAGEYFTARCSMVLIITGISLYYLGLSNFKKVWFAFFFLLFMIPIPAIIYYSATLPMQLFASKAASFILHIIGVPSLRQGNIIYLPEYALEVTEACSGLRSLSTLLALGALYGNLALPGKVRPIIIFISAVPIAIAGNVFRLLFTAIGAYAISTELAEDFLHELSGMLVFVFAMIVLLILGALLKWPGKRS
ncbi:MAG: exosortase/archaeosortase family protein [candidate division Zixibacteria bacterium]|nr:exosortase/archaeosortase family protein [candidate division Zixibacteria bacterium]